MSVHSKPERNYKTMWFCMGLFFVLWSIRATVLSPYIEPLQPVWLRLVVSNSFRIVLWGLPIVLFAMILQQPIANLKLQKASSYQVHISLIWFSGFLIFFLPVFFVKIQGNSFEVLFDKLTISYIVSAAIIGPVIEEILFRGFFLFKLMLKHRFWQANLIQAVIFAAIHFPYRIYTYGFQTTDIVLFVNLVGLGLLFGYSVKRTNSLWFAIVPHVINNLLAGMI